MNAEAMQRTSMSSRYSPPKAARHCAQCGAQYQPRAARQKYCDDHAQAPRHDKPRTMPTKVCGVCGKSFPPRQNSQKYCSPVCKVNATPRKPYLDAAGYVRAFVGFGYPRADAKGRMKEHRYVMQEHLGRPMLQTETVHHINGDRADNRIENLELRVGQHGKGATQHCPTCTCGSVVA
jgi:hypothetical protein